MLFDRFIFGHHLHEKEKLIFTIHKHWFMVYREGLKVAFFGLLVPCILFTIFPTTPALIIFGIWFLLGFGRFLYELADWYFDVLLITNQGVIDLDWRGIFDKSLARVDFETIVGANYEKIGVFANLLNFGNLTIEKEGHGEEILTLPGANKPAEAEQEVLLAREKYLHERGLEDEKVLRTILSGMVKRHLRRKRELGDLIS